MVSFLFLSQRESPREGGDELGRRAGGTITIYRPIDSTATLETVASAYHPAWDRCDRYARALHARNVAIVLGADPDQPDPVDAVTCWTPGGRVVGGTATAMRIAEAYGIPVTISPGSRHKPFHCLFNPPLPPS